MQDLKTLMDNGYPVGVRFGVDTSAPEENRLFCELVQLARRGESLSCSGQGCPVGDFVLGRDVSKPDDYYFGSGRYRTRAAAARAVDALPQLSTPWESIHMFPVAESGPQFDVTLLFLRPDKAMRLIQALCYHDGRPLRFMTGGTASICGDCTARPLNEQELCISLGCKGSRKHSNYGNDEVVIGIPFHLVPDIEAGLASIPGLFD